MPTYTALSLRQSDMAEYHRTLRGKGGGVGLRFDMNLKVFYFLISFIDGRSVRRGFCKFA